ncbi:MAG: FxsA family protein [Longimicrobiales bacterium]|nr:FxsA family protein [Longimicrobiales bacterium]
MIFLLFVLVPLIELALLIKVGQWIGAFPTILLVLFTGLAGAALARREGLRALRRVQSELASGRVPGDALMDGVAILLGGAFLLTPGVLTDLIGLSLLLPPTRGLAKAWARSAVERRIAEGSVRVHVGGFGLPWARREGSDADRQPLDPNHEIRPEDDRSVS